MGLFSLIAKFRGSNRIVEIADDLANRCRDAVWQRVRGRLGTLGLNEARGYIRARSAAVIHDEIEHLIKDQQVVKESQRAKLIELATEAMIRLMNSQAKTSRTQPVTVRRAA